MCISVFPNSSWSLTKNIFKNTRATRRNYSIASKTSNYKKNISCNISMFNLSLNELKLVTKSRGIKGYKSCYKCYKSMLQKHATTVLVES